MHTEPPPQSFSGPDGATLAYREFGEGRPLVLLHGMFGTGGWWTDPGPAGALAEAGYRVILPDLRAHGLSAGPRDPAAYPPDVLVSDGFALLAQLGLGGDTDYLLGGYSLGARVALRMLVHGARPARAVLGGQGLTAVLRASARGINYRVLNAMLDGVPLQPGSAEQGMAQWISRGGGDPLALRHVLDSLVPSTMAELGRCRVRTLVLAGTQDAGQDTAAELADALPDATFLPVPGDHVSALAAPGLAGSIADFLAQP